MQRQLSLAVVGADHPNKRGPGRRFEIALCKPGDPVELRPEPKNPADPRAVAVYSERGVQIGYLTAERAPLIATMVRDHGEPITLFQGATRYGCAIRAGFGMAPDVPPIGEEIPWEEPAFYPDEDWPD